MASILHIGFKGLEFCRKHARLRVATLATRSIFFLNGIRSAGLRSSGVPIVRVARGGRIELGESLQLNSNADFNAICTSRTSFYAGPGAVIRIGDRVGISGSVLSARVGIEIGDDVKIGAGCQILDSDCHSLDPEVRNGNDPGRDIRQTVSRPIRIGVGVFLGARCIVGKGVEIGEQAIVATGSVVVRSIPPREIWGGNPARFLRKV